MDQSSEAAIAQLPLHIVQERASNELRRIVLQLIALSKLSNAEIAREMGYGSRDIVSEMRNHRYGQAMYAKPVLLAFLYAVGVCDPKYIYYVLWIYSYASGRPTTRHAVFLRPDWRDWWKEDVSPDTEGQPIDRRKRARFADLIGSS